ncbi:MAG: dockerin type I repeat-containing protein [Muribaculaceae bacterium]|nr:dockerin type I repeat-containing protein [Muribaculaceae bacterium]
MKKSLLTLALVALTCASAGAKTDGQVYEPVDGVKIANQWILDRVHTPETYTKMGVCNTRARTATMDEGIVYVSHSEAKTIVVAPGDTVVAAVIYRFDAKTGEQLPDLDVTLNGRPYGTFLGVTSIGVDNFHHIWVAPMTSDLATKIPFYMLDKETGELTLLQELEKGDVLHRTDYLDVMGDITRQEATCTVMTVAYATADPGWTTIYRWYADYDDEFVGGFKGQPSLEITEFYPETKAGFSLAPIVKMCLGLDPEDIDDYYAGESFYIDCFDGAPTLYNFKGNLLDTFEEVDKALWPQSQPNGMIEFMLDNERYFAYVIADMNGNGHGCQANVCKYEISEDEDPSFAAMKKYWQIPADSLGKVNDTGLRVHCFAVENGTDEEGNEEVTLMTFKAYNGIAVYKIGRNVEGPDPGGEVLVGDVNGDGEIGIADVTALVSLILTTQQPTGDLLKRADVNQDGEVGIADLTALVAKLLEQQ